MECTEFEALLSEAMDGDGRLSPARKESFDAHRRVCAVCGPLFAEVQAGREWLRSLEEIEPPAHLVHNILVATSGVESKRPLTLRPTDGRPRWANGCESGGIRDVHSRVRLRAAATVCDVVRDDLLHRSRWD